ncbi:unnamed protein product [Phytophthora fragariaefolia]|uniref:Unnamed protein product n=1 Tax=Phytophthora fragariaefolia TaxID=1490495 RepID=A0A9W6YHH7_9STRA|nr:unnamed protein product [Phytophthora fragariaefolia]
MMDLLPTATMEIKGERKPVKIDTGAQYSVAGECWAPYGVKLDVPPPVDFMEGFSGAAVKTDQGGYADFTQRETGGGGTRRLAGAVHAETENRRAPAAGPDTGEGVQREHPGTSTELGRAYNEAAKS